MSRVIIRILDTSRIGTRKDQEEIEYLKSIDPGSHQPFKSSREPVSHDLDELIKLAQACAHELSYKKRVKDVRGVIRLMKRMDEFTNSQITALREEELHVE